MPSNLRLATCALASALVTLGATASARADEPAPSAPASAAAHPAAVAAVPAVPAVADRVELKTGGALSGKATEIAPGDHVTLTLADGRIATIRWDGIARIVLAAPTSAAPTAPVVASPLSPAPPTPVTSSPFAPSARLGFRRVHIEGAPSAELEQQTGPSSWRVVCRAPCDRDLEVDAHYRIGGDGVRHTRTFRLVETADRDLTLHVSPATNGRFFGGIAIASVGVAGAAVGEALVFLAFTGGAVSSTLETQRALDAGLVIMGVSLLPIAGGIVLLATNARSGVEQSVGAQVASPTPPPDAREPSPRASVAPLASASPWDPETTRERARYEARPKASLVVPIVSLAW